MKRLGLMVFALGCASRPSPVESSVESSAYGTANDRGGAPAQALEGKTDSAVAEESSPKGSLSLPKGGEERAIDSSASAGSTTPLSALEEVRRVMIRVSEDVGRSKPMNDEEVRSVLLSGRLAQLLNLIASDGYLDVHPDRNPPETRCLQVSGETIDVCARGLVSAAQGMRRALATIHSKFALPPEFTETADLVVVDILASEYILEFSKAPLALRAIRHAGGRTGSH